MTAKLLLMLSMWAQVGVGTPPPNPRVYPLGKPFALEVGISSANVQSLRATLTSTCDNEKIVESSDSYRRDGKYFATMFVPRLYGACTYELEVLYWLPDYSSPELAADLGNIEIK